MLPSKPTSFLPLSSPSTIFPLTPSQMDQESFSIFKKSQLPLLQIIPFLLITFFSETQSIYWNSTRCEPQHCGSNREILIQYPFWIPGRQESYCGSGLQFITTCKDNHPILKISNDDYIILDVNYTENSVVLARPEVYDQNNKCPVPQTNFSVKGTPFKNGPDTAEVYFFYNCSKPYIRDGSYPIQCASNNSDYAFAVFHTEKLDEFNESCQAPVNSPVSLSTDNIDDLTAMDYIHILKMGFVLLWDGVDCRNCNNSGNHCGSDNGSFICFCKDNVGRKSCGKGGLNIGLKIAIGFGAAGGTAIVMCLVFFLYQINQKKSQAEVALISHRSPSYPSSVSGNEKSGTLFGVHVFTYNDLEDATNKFDPNNIVGDGGFGTVYKGKLQDGRFIAVKRMYENNFRMVEQFLNEVEMLRRLRHRNLVTLYGCTSRHSRELLLVYEYISNGTVADHLHGPFAKPGSLPWVTRMSIATETACALAYLHASDVIHRDVKTNNILLDSNFCVKVADFGLSRLFPTHVTHVSTAPQGTPGYVDPEYHQCYHLTDRSDVFSFGVVLIELISSKPAVDITRHRHEINLSNMAVNKIQNDELHELVDPELGYESDDKIRTMIDAVAELSFRCLQSQRDTRPSMEEVFKSLQDLQGKDGGVKVEEKLKSKQMFSSQDTCIDLTSRSTTSSTSS